MGVSKALIEIDGEKLSLKTANLLSNYVDEVYFSGRSDQKELFDEAPFPFIPDQYNNIGPIAGILSAFELESNEEKALLIVATDLPLLNKSTLLNLINKRQPGKLATMYRQRNSGFLEPMCAIYEPNAYKKLSIAVKKGSYAVHRILDPSEIESISYDENKALTNMNYPEQLEDLI